MPLEINMQFNIVLFSILAGFITGILFDIYRIIRGFNNIKVIIIIEDILFWILASIIVFTFLLYTNYAFLTPYVYAFICCSIFFYIKFISRYLYNTEKKLLDLLLKISRVTLKNLGYPIKIMFYKLIDKNK